MSESFYSSGVFEDTATSTGAAIEELVRSLRPRDGLGVAAAIRKIVRQHSEETLRRAEDRMQLAQEVGRIGCFEIDMRDGTSVGTPAFFELYGLPGNRGSWSQQEWLSFIHPDDRAGVIAHLKVVAMGAEMTTVEYRVLRADGEVRWTASRARVETGADGRQIRAYGVQQDITERKVAELALFAAEAEARRKAEHLSNVLESTSDCVYSLDLNWRISYLNGRARAYFEAGDDLTGKSILEVFPDGRHSDFRACLKSAMEERVSATAEGFLPSRGRWYELQVTPSEAGITVFFRDISDRKLLAESQRDAADRWRATLDVIPQMVWSMHAGTRRPDFYNDRWYEFTGLPQGSCAGPEWEALVHPADQESALAIWRHSRATGEAYEAQYRLRRRCGEYRWIISRARLEVNERGEHVRWYGTCTDVHERILEQQELAASEKRVQNILNSVPQIIWCAGPDGQLDFVSNQRDRVYRGSAGQVLGTGWVDMVHPQDQGHAFSSWSSSLASGEPYEAEFRILQPSGDYSWTLVRALPERNGEGQIVRWYGTCTDIHQRVLAQAGLQESETLNRGIIEASPDCVWLLDSGGKILFVNGATLIAAEVSDASALVGHRWGSGFSEIPRARADAAIARAQACETARLVMKSGPKSDRWVDIVVAPILDENGSPVRLVVISRDITEQKQAEEKAQWAANHDSLTQLPNRFLLQQRVDAEIERAQALSGGFALMMLDVDHLKRVNDGLGHDAGDALLLEIANRLKLAVRDSDTVARLGGDEFAIVLAGVGATKKVEAAAKSIMECLAAPFAYGGRMLDCHASIGVSLFPGQGHDRADLMKNADVALYAAKSSARGNFRIFEPAFRKEMQKRSSMLSLAKDALNNDWVVPYYQPIVEFGSGTLAGYEALLRWRHPKKGIQPPATIAAAFEDINVAADISDRMIDRIIGDIRRWRDEGTCFGHVAINAAAAEFRRGGFAESLLERLSVACIPVSEIHLEVTEAVFLGRGAECVERALKMLSREGMKIALDDFGTGYASLSHLKQFPVDIIKIDRSFVRGIGCPRGGEAIISAVISMGHNLSIEVVAEGIESASQHEFLLKEGCRYGQGYLYGKAVPAQRVRRHSKGTADAPSKNIWKAEEDCGRARTN